jgi:hypothetical protein
VTQERQTEATAGTETQTTGDAVVESGGQSVEEVEAFWRNRQSGQDRAHNAETAALRAQIEAMQKAPPPVPEGESPEAARVRELEEALKVERTARQAEALRAQYPLAAGVLGEAVAGLPPEKLAAMEAALDSGAQPGGPPIIDPNAAPRQRSGVAAAAAKPLNEKSKDELLADLAKIAPAYQEARKEGLV